MREAILNAIPLDMKIGIAAAIGFFLAFLGLKCPGIIVFDPSTIIAMRSLMALPAFLALIGIIITLVLYVKEVPASVFVGSFVTAIIGVIFTACGFSAGDALMPTLPAHIVSVNFDVSLFCGFTK